MGAPRRPVTRRLLPSTAAPRQEPGTGQAILVVEPHPPLGELIGDALRDEGYRPVLATNMPQAVALLEAERFVLVLADPLRPEPAATTQLTRPWSHLERIRALAGETPVVICTAYSAWAFADYRRRGFGDLLLKPFTLRQLLATVRRNLAQEDRGGTAPEGELGAPRSAEWPPA